VTELALDLRRRLEDFGLSGYAIRAAWPDWWSDFLDGSSSARVALRLSLARNLGIEAASLLDEASQPTFIWRDQAHLKNVTIEELRELEAIVSFGKALSSILICASPPAQKRTLPSAARLRQVILRKQPYVSVFDLASICRFISIPVVYLRIFPWPQMRMAAMTVRTELGGAMMLGKETDFPAPLAFCIAHQLAHIALGHVQAREAIVDFDTNELNPVDDAEERAANEYALELLTGQTSPIVLPGAQWHTAERLAEEAIRASTELRVEPGILALCSGYATGDRQGADSAMGSIYADPKPAWMEINRLARINLRMDAVTADSRSYLEYVLGSRRMEWQPPVKALRLGWQIVGMSA
jgi:hypothetical protein